MKSLFKKKSSQESLGRVKTYANGINQPETIKFKKNDKNMKNLILLNVH